MHLPSKPFNSNQSLPQRARRHGLWPAALGIALVLSVSWMSDCAIAGSMADDLFADLQSAKGKKYTGYAHVRWRIDAILCCNGRDLADWTLELLDKKPQTLKETLIRIDIMLRAGLDEEAAKTIRQLKSFDPPGSAHPMAFVNSSCLIRSLRERWWGAKTAVAACEYHPEYQDFCSGACLEQLPDKLRKEGWSKKKIDEWLIHLQDQVNNRPIFFGYEICPKHLSYQERPSSCWTYLLCKNQKTSKEKEEFFTQSKKQVEKNPADTPKILDFLKAWDLLWRETNSYPDEPAWAAKTAKPEGTLDAYYLGKLLVELRQYEPAQTMLVKAQELLANPTRNSAKASEQIALLMDPYKKKEHEEAIEQLLKDCKSNLKNHPSSQPPQPFPWTPGQGPPTLSDQIPSDPERQRALAEERLDNLKELQRCLNQIVKQVEQADLSTKDQAKKEHPPIKLDDLATEKDKALLREKKIKKNDPEYWLYLVQQHDKPPYPKNKPGMREKIEYAYKKGMELSDPAVWPDSEKRKREMDLIHQHLIYQYQEFLSKNHRYREAVRFLLAELQKAPRKSYTEIEAAAALGDSGHRYEYLIKPDEPILWTWLDQCHEWRDIHEGILDLLALSTKRSIRKRTRSLDNEAPKEIYTYVERVESLAEKGHWSRMACCAKLMLRERNALGISPNPERLIPLLEARIQKGDIERDNVERLLEPLHEAYIKCGYLQKIEKLLDNDSAHPRRRRIELTLLALKKGDKAMAMRNWQRSVNCGWKDKQQIELNRQMRRHGLGDQIDAFYAKIKKKLPQFVYSEE